MLVVFQMLNFKEPLARRSIKVSMSEVKDEPKFKRPALWYAMAPVLVLVALLAINVLLYKDGATNGPNQIA